MPTSSYDRLRLLSHNSLVRDTNNALLPSSFVAPTPVLHYVQEILDVLDHSDPQQRVGPPRGIVALRI